MKYKTNRSQISEFIQEKENKQLDNKLTNKIMDLWGCFILHVSQKVTASPCLLSVGEIAVHRKVICYWWFAKKYKQPTTNNKQYQIPRLLSGG